MEAKQIFKINKDQNGITSPLGEAMRLIVQQNGAEIYTDREQLPELLKKQGISDIQIKQVEIVLMSSTFLRYLNQLSQGISAVDINNIIQSAAVSGMKLEKVKKIVSALLYGVGINQKLDSEYFPEVCRNLLHEDFYINPYACDQEIGKIENQIAARTDLTETQFSYLNYCCAAGIPKAARILGEMYLFGIQVESDLRKASEYLKYAVRAGDAKSMYLLGDYYYQNAHYNEAYELYTGPGTYAVNKQRQEMVQNLSAIRVYNKKTINVWLVSAVLLEAVMFLLLFSSPITGSHLIAAILCTILNIGAAVILILTNKNAPFSDLRMHGLLLSLIVFIYSFAYIFF